MPQHPIHILPSGEEFEMNPTLLSKLQENCDSIVFNFEAQGINGRADRRVTVDLYTNVGRLERYDDCICQDFRSPTECNCMPTQCHYCGQQLMGLESGCTSETCINDDCPACRHYREGCAFDDALQYVRHSLTNLANRTTHQTDAEALDAAVSRWFAPGHGDTPLFPAVTRILNTILNPDQDPNATPDRWVCPDGSVINIHNGRWLETG